MSFHIGVYVSTIVAGFLSFRFWAYRWMYRFYNDGRFFLAADISSTFWVAKIPDFQYQHLLWLKSESSWCIRLVKIENLHKFSKASGKTKNINEKWEFLRTTNFWENWFYIFGLTQKHYICGKHLKLLPHMYLNYKFPYMANIFKKIIHTKYFDPFWAIYSHEKFSNFVIFF